MTKLSLRTLAMLAAMPAASAAHAQHYAGHCSQCQSNYSQSHTDQCIATYHDNSMWPSQYTWPSRRAICQAFELQTVNGWRRHNLLGKHDFTPDGEGLSEAGRLRVAWILTQAPPHRRTIFVARGVDQAETAGRVEMVQALAATFGTGLGAVDVQETYMRDYGRSAAGVDAVFTKFQEGQLNYYPPTLQASGIQTGAASGGQ